MNTQICRTCKKEKLLDKFYKNALYPNGYLNQCKDCVREYDKKRALKHPGPINTGVKICSFCKKTKSVSEFTKRLRAKDGLRNRCKECDHQEEKKYRIKNPNQSKFCKIKNKYGLSKQQYYDILNRQNHTCAICNSKIRLHVDHCHQTNKVRGILCYLCNVGLGSFRDNLQFLENAIKYLKDNN